MNGNTGARQDVRESKGPIRHKVRRYKEEHTEHEPT